MIDIESIIFNRIATVFRASYPDGFIAGEYVPQPPRFPSVSLVEVRNEPFRMSQDSGSLERHARIEYEVNIYSNKDVGKKAECREIAKIIDEEFAKLGFTRRLFQPVQNFADSSIYRIYARYRATVGDDLYVYST